MYTQLDLVLDSSNSREMHLFDNINMCLFVYSTNALSAQFCRDQARVIKEGENSRMKNTHSEY